MQSLKPALAVMTREVRDQLRDWRIVAPIILLTLIFPSIMNYAAERMVAFVVRFGAELVADRLIPFLLMVVGFFPISVSLVIALESFVGEKERRSIEPLLSSPLTDWQIYLGKLIAVMLPPLAASYLGIGVYLIGVYRKLGWLAPTELLVQILILTFVQAFVMVSGAVIISIHATTIRSANLLASFIIIPMAFLLQGESMVMFWAQYDTLWWAILGLVIIAILLVRTGIGHFNREELLGRELDILNPRWMWSVFWGEFIGGANSFGQWLRFELINSLRKHRLPILATIAILAVSAWVGSTQADIFVIPSQVISADSVDPAKLTGIERIELFSTKGLWIIFNHNLRVILAATLLGVFSFGVLGILVVMLPFMMIGYLMATMINAGMPGWKFLAAFILPHGIFEVPAVLLAAAVIFRLGAGLAGPAMSGRSIGEGLLRALADWLKMMLGFIIPLLLAAAAMEALVTPKIAVWLLTH